MSLETACGSQLPNVTFTFNLTSTLEVMAPLTSTSEVCLELIEPISFDYCQTDEWDGLDAYPTCTIAINGVDCTSCAFTVIDDTTTADEEDFLVCRVVDCTNTDYEFEGTVCDDTSIVSAVIAESLLYDYLPCPDACFLCGSEDSSTSTPNAPFLDDDLSCGFVELLALTGYPIIVDACSELSTEFQDACSCVEVRTTFLPAVVVAAVLADLFTEREKPTTDTHDTHMHAHTNVHSALFPFILFVLTSLGWLFGCLNGWLLACFIRSLNLAMLRHVRRLKRETHLFSTVH
jgi:hypothetical protein